jgi:hypothetical protein
VTKPSRRTLTEVDRWRRREVIVVMGFSAPMRGARGPVILARRISFPDTKLAEDPAEEIFGIMPADDIADGIECAPKLDRNELR